jgi:hypothetical protein
MCQVLCTCAHCECSTSQQEDSKRGGHGYWPEWRYGSLAEPNQCIVHCMQKNTVQNGGVASYALLSLECNRIVGPAIGGREY